jgi:hypothetical protein
LRTAGGFRGELGKQDGEERRMVGRDKTLLLWDAMLENREKAGHYICQEGTPLSTSQEEFSIKQIILLVNKIYQTPPMLQTLG